MEFFIEKSILQHEKVDFYKMCLNFKKVKNGYFLQFKRKKLYIVFIFLFLIKTLKSIENYYKSDFWCKIIFFFRKIVKELVFL